MTAGQAAEVMGLPPESWREITDEEAAELQQLTPEEALQQKIAVIDAETSAAIVAGFDFEIGGLTLHFSYDANDQQNFADTANVATLAQMGVPGLPETITWNGWQLEIGANDKELSRTLIRVELTMVEFLGLYTRGALTHKATQMELGSRRKAALYEAVDA